MTDTLDLTPRKPAPTNRSAWKKYRAFGFIAVLVLALGVVVFRGLGDATLFFLNVDEAVEQREDLGDRRFRIQGSVVPESVVETPLGVEFDIVYDGVNAHISHEGDPPQLFQPDIPVVLEGQWRGEVFTSNRMVIKHSEVYEADNPNRVEDYQEQPTSQ